VYFGPVPLAIIDGLTLKLVRRHRDHGSTVGRGGQPPLALLPGAVQQSVTHVAGLKCYPCPRPHLTP
jgi:hypothetical protein